MTWTVTVDDDFSCRRPIFIEGLPGIGNVGKIAIDYLIDQLDAKPVANFFSKTLPNSVFVNENNLVQLPRIDLFHVRIAKKDFLFLSGDTQPSQEESSYELTEALVSLLETFDTKEIITTGGIGMDEMPEDSGVYVTGNNPKLIKRLVKVGADSEIYGIVGPIVGVSGLLLGLASQPAAALLVETYAHPMYVGLKEARALIEMLDKRYGFGISLAELDEEIRIIEEELGDTDVVKKTKYGRPVTYSKDVNYIG